MNVENKPFFSVVIYLSNDCAKDTLDSIFMQSDIQQSDIQIILACSDKEDYAEYISELKNDNENINVCESVFKTQSAAYAEAIKMVKGKYVCFPECGGVYRENTFAYIKAIFEVRNIYLATVMPNSSTNKNLSEVSRAIKSKPGNCDLNEKYDFPLVFLSGCFISTKLVFDINTKLDIKSVSECDMMLKLATQTQTINIFKNKSVSFKPWIGNSPIFGFFDEFRDSPDKLQLFLDEFITAHKNRCLDEFGCIPKFVQYNLMIFLKWSFTAPSAEKIFMKLMSIEDYEKYLKELLVHIDDNVINNCGLQLAYKLLIFRIKHDGKIRFVRRSFTKRLYFKNAKVCELSTNIMNIDFVELETNKVKFRGRIKFAGCGKDEFALYALVNQEEKFAAKDIGNQYDTLVWGRNEYPGMSFEIEIDLEGKDEAKIEFFCIHKGDIVKKSNIVFGRFTPICSTVRNSYYYKDKRIMKYSNKNSIITISKASFFDKIKSEHKYLKTLSSINNDYAKHAYYARMLYHLIKPFFRKDIWLISDRTNKSDDNGEAFFKYMQKVNNKDLKCYFVIDKNTEDAKKMAKIGKVISVNSKKHKVYHLLSSYIISSQANNPVVNPFLRGNIYYRDILCEKRFVFLQHGVIKDDLSSWLNLYNRNIFGFVVTTNQEYQSILDYDYFYKPENVWLTGLPRHDYLYHDEKKYITIMPTWRKSLMKYPDPSTGIWILRDDYKQSKYYKFYNSLFNNKKLLEAAKKYGYKICCKPHPIIEPYIDLFDKNDDVIFFDAAKSYREIFAESNLMLTDYSSVAFDFAYLRKPIIYTQFDKDAFFSGEHSYTAGYYDYERDGFGEVVYDIESTVDLIIDYMKNDCKTKDKYLKRINDTFAFSDKNCSERVYKKLIEGNK